MMPGIPVVQTWCTCSGFQEQLFQYAIPHTAYECHTEDKCAPSDDAPGVCTLALSMEPVHPIFSIQSAIMPVNPCALDDFDVDASSCPRWAAPGGSEALNAGKRDGSLSDIRVAILS